MKIPTRVKNSAKVWATKRILRVDRGKLHVDPNAIKRTSAIQAPVEALVLPEMYCRWL